VNDYITKTLFLKGKKRKEESKKTKRRRLDPKHKGKKRKKGEGVLFFPLT